MIDQLIIGENESYNDFKASIHSRTIGQSKKKSIKETVPFSNITYDFSAINGEIYWEERDLTYKLEMTASTPDELEGLKIALSNWLMNVMQEKICDPFIEDYHFVGTYEDMDFADDESMLKTTATVKFKAYPYKVANYPKVYNATISAGNDIELTIANDSAHRITPTVTTDKSIILTVGGTAYTIGTGETTDDRLKIAAGVNTLKIHNSGSAACNVTITFYEEVF